MRVIIYGLGKGLEYIEQNLKKEHEIIGYSDSYATLSVFRGKPFYTPEKLSTIDFDYIVIAVRNRKVAYKIYEMLTGEHYGLEERKVIPFYVYANGEYWDYCMAHADVENIEGLIFGTSYARNNILVDYLSVPFVNLGVPSQDMYANLESFKACIQKYGDRLKRLKYIIIDMFDYNYFNFDASLCKLFFTHLEYGGIINKHNFDENRNYEGAFEKELFSGLGIMRDRVSEVILDRLFEEHYALEHPINTSCRWKCIEHATPLPMGHFQSFVMKKRDAKTVKENIKNFEMLISAIEEFNPDIKVLLILFPKYITLEETKDSLIGTWKEEFNEIVERVCEKENVFFKNYKFCSGIADNRHLWFDIDHMNTIGARCMTSIIEEDLKREIY